MWLPNTDPSGSGLISDVRFRGQEGAAADAPMHSHLGVLGITGFLMRDLTANPLDYVEGGALNARRQELSPWLDSTAADLSRFAKRGGKMIVTIGTDDTLASPGAQLDYYQSLVDTMGQARLDAFARLFVMPQAGHGLSGRNYGIGWGGEGGARRSHSQYVRPLLARWRTGSSARPHRAGPLSSLPVTEACHSARIRPTRTSRPAGQQSRSSRVRN